MAVGFSSTRVRNTLELLRTGHADAILVGLLAFLVSVIGADRPSLWFDEAATISVATRTMPEIFALLDHVDAVHGLYYAMMHAWFSVFPATEFWARVPSAVLIGATAAGLVVLGRALSSRSVAVAAGLVFAVLPRTTWAGIEARSYALSMFDAVWVTVLCVIALRRGRIWLRAAYVLALVVAIVGNVFMVLIVAVHAVVVLKTARSRRDARVWGVSVLIAVTAVAPLVWVMLAQQSQVSWIWPVGPGTLGQFLGDQYFPAVMSDSAQVTGLDPAQAITSEQVWVALRAWALVLPFILVVVAILVKAARMRRQPSPVTGETARLVALTSATWVLVPTGVVVAYSLVRSPIYQPHYMSFTAPGLALLIGLGVVTVGREPRRVAVILAVLGAAAMPNYVAQRGPYAKFGADYSTVADLIDAQASPGDCLNVDVSRPSKLMEAVKGGRLESFAKLRDDGLLRSAVERVALFESRAPIAGWAGNLSTCPRLWTIAARNPSLPAHETGPRLSQDPLLAPTDTFQLPAALGFRPVERWQFNAIQVVRSDRSAR